jgi:hypothetical protein
VLAVLAVTVVVLVLLLRWIAGRTRTDRIGEPEQRVEGLESDRK